MATVVLQDNSYGTLGASLASTASSITFTAGHGARFPAVVAGQVLYACLLNSNNVLEEIQITTHTSSADTADVVRAIGGTTAKAWSSGDRIEVRLSSTAIRNLFADPLAVTGTGSSVITGPVDISAATAGQIAFPASQNASSGANVLDDYEEGNWTPGIAFTAISSAITYTAQVGRYTKIGNRVAVNGYIALSSKGTATGVATVTGLPFASQNTANDNQCAAVVLFQGSGISGDISAYVLPNATPLNLSYLGTGSDAALTNTHFGDTTSMMVSFAYQAAT